jgi:hypothetical protein
MFSVARPEPLGVGADVCAVFQGRKTVLGWRTVLLEAVWKQGLYKIRSYVICRTRLRMDLLDNRSLAMLLEISKRLIYQTLVSGQPLTPCNRIEAWCMLSSRNNHISELSSIALGRTSPVLPRAFFIFHWRKLYGPYRWPSS